MSIRNVVLTISALLLFVSSATLRLNAICSGGYQNYGYLQQYYCVYNTEDCQGDTCESDLCDGAVCGYGQGWITYCTGAACAQYPGCLSCF